jgi:predicted transcriptional regulator
MKAKQVSVLLSVKPKFANLIFNGNKKFEFRKSIFRKSVKRILVYASSPVQQVIGEFTIHRVLYDTLPELWEQTRDHAGISEEVFYSYFAQKDAGYAIAITKVIKYKKPKTLSEFSDGRPPQSFAYIHKSNDATQSGTPRKASTKTS